MKLLVSGDSWTAGYPMADNSKAWPSIVSNTLNFELTDKSRSGSSNYRIYRKAFDGVLTRKHDLCIVALTQWARFETGANFGEKPGSIYQHVFGNYNSKEYKFAYKNFFNGYKQYADLLRQIISLQQLAKNCNVDCFFIDTFERNLIFDLSMHQFLDILKTNTELYNNLSDKRRNEKFQVVKYLEKQINKQKFISKKSYKEIIRDCEFKNGHPLEDGHRIIADVIINFLKGREYDKTI
jgi:hypothetical protein